MANFPGTAGNDTLAGTADADTFNISLGGTDTVTGAGGDDVITAGAAFDALDQVNGGQGYDRLDLLGDYSGGVTFGINTLRAVEEIKLGSGFSYKLKTHEATVAAGATLKIDAYSVGAGKTVHFDGSAETNGSFLFYDGQSHDTFIGGALSDSISLAYNGNDKVYGNGGDDVVTCEATFDAGDLIDGGAGNDVVYLRGSSYNGFTISGAMMKSVETLGLAGNFQYGITVQNNVVAAGENLYITAEGLSGAGRASFNGSAEKDGTFTFRDGINNDNFTGGQLNDVFWAAGGGHDIFQGQGGDDTFYMYGNLDAEDMVLGGSGRDGVILSGDYSAGVIFDMFTLSGIEYLSTYDGFNYSIKTDDATVGANKTFEVQASYLSAGYSTVFDGSAETDGNFAFYGGAGNDTFIGGAGKDYFDASSGGNDSFHGGGGNDHASFFDTYTTDDFFDGGAGSDSVYLYGTFAGGLTLGMEQFVNVESITLGPGHSYNVTALDSLVAAGKSIAFDTYWSEAGHAFVFDGLAETDGTFRLTGGNGNDHFTGGAMNDIFYLNRGGNDVMNGGGGNDTFHLSEGFTADDQIHGGDGVDRVAFSTETPTKLAFKAGTFSSIEKFDFFWGRSYNVQTHDANLAAGQTMTVTANFLAAEHSLRFDGSAETDGSFVMTGGAGGDLLFGGAMADTLNGGAGQDTLRGNAGNDILDGGADADTLWGGEGNDTFVFKSVADSSTGAGSDTIRDWNAGDIIDLLAIDADTTMDGNQAFSFIGSAGFSGAGQLRVVNNGTTTFVRGDVDGDGTADFTITLTGVHALTADSFIL